MKENDPLRIPPNIDERLQDGIIDHLTERVEDMNEDITDPDELCELPTREKLIEAISKVIPKYVEEYSDNYIGVHMEEEKNNFDTEEEYIDWAKDHIKGWMYENLDDEQMFGEMLNEILLWD